MAYHIDTLTSEPVRCTALHGECGVGGPEAHYGNISEAVRERAAGA